MNANSTPDQVGTTQLTTLALFDDLRDRKSLDLREVGRGGGDRTQHPKEVTWFECLAINQQGLKYLSRNQAILPSETDTSNSYRGEEGFAATQARLEVAVWLVLVFRSVSIRDPGRPNGQHR